MVEIKNSPPDGVSAASIDVDQIVTSDTMNRLAGDVAYLDDVVSGNDATNFLNHSGPGRGAHVNIPLTNTVWPRVGIYTRSSDASPADPGSRILWAFATFVPPGVTELRVYSEFSDPGFTPRVVLNSTTSNTIDMDVQSGDESTIYTTQHIRFGHLNGVPITVSPNQVNTIWCASDEFVEGLNYTHPTIRLRTVSGALVASVAGGTSEGTFSTRTKSTPPGAVPDVRRFDDMTTNADTSTQVPGMIAANRPLSTWVVTEINRDLNTLGEQITGIPARGQGSLTLGAGLAGLYNNSGYQSGGEYVSGRRIVTHLHGQCYGQIPLGADTALVTTRNAPIAIGTRNASATNVTVARARIMTPFTVGNSMRCCALVYLFANGESAPITVSATNANGETGTLTQTVPDNEAMVFDFALNLAGSNGTGGAVNEIELSISHGALKDGGALRVLAWSIYIAGDT